MPSIRARVAEIRAENEAECPWGRKQPLDFYRDLLKRGARMLTPEGVPWSQSKFLGRAVQPVVAFGRTRLDRIVGVWP